MRACTGMDAQLSATRGGVLGGLLALSALERSSLRRIALQALPCQGGFVALYHGEALGTCTTVHGMRVHVVLTIYGSQCCQGALDGRQNSSMQFLRRVVRCATELFRIVLRAATCAGPDVM